jgi:hypothetical protein
MIRLRSVGRVALIVIAALVALFALLLAYLWLSGRVWYPRQRSRVAELDREATVALDEDLISISPLDDDGQLSSLRMIASHNSYHREPDAVRRALIDFVEPGTASTLRYSHQPLWDQLENGVRSFELDVRARRNRFTITHVPLVDNTGPHPDFALTLREIVLWSERRPGHVPVIVLLELKSDYMFLDPGLVDWDADALRRLDDVVRDVIPPERLLTPAMVRGDYRSLTEAVQQAGWPTLRESRNRIMLVVHTDAQIDPLYIADDPGLAERPMFTSRPGSLESARPDAVVVIHNDPNIAAIERLLAQNMLVRTRADADGSAPPDQLAAALASGAQIISTDFPPGHPDVQGPGIVEFAPCRTLAQNAW